MAKSLDILSILRIETHGPSKLAGREPEPPVILIQLAQFKMQGRLIRNRESGQVFLFGPGRAFLPGQQPAEFLVRLRASRVEIERLSELAFGLRIVSHLRQKYSQVPVNGRIP